MADGEVVLAVTAVGRIADLVVEGSHARARRVPLFGIMQPLIRRRAEVPALAVEQDAAAVHAVGRGRERAHGVLHGLDVAHGVQIHQVEAEAVHLVGRGPARDGVHHQLLHHLELGGGVRTAARVVEMAVVIITMIVAGHHAIQHGAALLPGAIGVVVDDVQHHAQAILVERLHHLAEL